METLVIINTAINIVVVFALLYGRFFSRFQFQWKKTFWDEYKYGLELYFWRYPLGTYPNSGRRIFHVSFISDEEVDAREKKEYAKRH